MDQLSFAIPLAQTINVGGQTFEGPLQGVNNLGDLINLLMSFLVPLGAIILFFIILWGGYDFILSQGQQDKIESAKMKITAGIIGFILLALSYILVAVIGQIFGVGGGLF